jgi:hypothetical protein
MIQERYHALAVMSRIKIPSRRWSLTPRREAVAEPEQLRLATKTLLLMIQKSARVGEQEAVQVLAAGEHDCWTYEKGATEDIEGQWLIHDRGDLLLNNMDSGNGFPLVMGGVSFQPKHRVANIAIRITIAEA